MNIKEWKALSLAEQDGLASTYGITRSGEDNQLVKEEELTKIPVKVVDEKPKEKTEKPVVEEAPKRSNRKRASRKPKSRSSK